MARTTCARDSSAGTFACTHVVVNKVYFQINPGLLGGLEINQPRVIDILSTVSDHLVLAVKDSHCVGIVLGRINAEPAGTAHQADTPRVFEPDQQVQGQSDPRSVFYVEAETFPSEHAASLLLLVWIRKLNRDISSV